jgi:hypothetical protein
MRIQIHRPNTNWGIVWENLHETPIPQWQRMTWYKAIHDIVCTNERLHRIHMTPTDKCRHCGYTDTLLHRISQCGAGRMMWNWTANKIANILRKDRHDIPTAWLLSPESVIIPKRKKGSCAVAFIPAGHLQARRLPFNTPGGPDQLSKGAERTALQPPTTTNPCGRLPTGG